MSSRFAASHGAGAVSRLCCRLALGALLFLRAVSAVLAQGPGEVRSPFALPPAEVVVWNRPVAVLHAPFGGHSPEERARAASARIEAQLDRLEPKDLSHELVSGGFGRGVLIIDGTQVLFGLTPEDLPQGDAKTLDAAGRQIVGTLRDILVARAEQRRWPNLLRSIAESALAALMLLGVWAVVAGARRVVFARIQAFSDRRSGQLAKVGRDARAYAVALMRWLTRGVSFLLVVGAAYLAVVFALSRFAYTRRWSSQLDQLLLATAGQIGAAIAHAIPDLLMLAAILLITRGAARLADKWFRAVERGEAVVAWMDADAARVTRRLFLIVIWLFALTVAYPYIPGSGSEAFKGISVFVGLVVSLGSTGVVGQIVSGLFVVFNRVLRPGDYVRIGTLEGTVQELGATAVRLVTPASEEVTVPNTMLVADSIHNFSRPGADAVIVTTSVTIGYDAPWRQVQAMLLLAAARTPELLHEPRPAVLTRALDDFYTRYELITHAARGSARAAVLSRLHGEILDVFNEHGVQILSPHFVAQPSEAVVVPKARWFEAPADPGRGTGGPDAAPPGESGRRD